MCDACKEKPSLGPSELTDEQVKAVIGIARRVAFDQISTVFKDVMKVVDIDDRTERLLRAAMVVARFLEQQTTVN
jgi:hypothetical protein